MPIDIRTGLSVLAMVIAGVSAYYASKIQGARDVTALQKDVTALQKEMAVARSAITELADKTEVAEIAADLTELQGKLDQLQTENVNLSGQLDELAAATIPPGTIAAFEDKCPNEKGWNDFKDADGRFIIGIGTYTDRNDNKQTFKSGDNSILIDGLEVRGEYAVSLSFDQMPNHDHAVYRHAAEIVGDQPGSVEGAGNKDDNRGGRVRDNSRTGTAGRGLAHNNMPPFIALFWCRKI